MSKVIQKGPAFLDRTSSATSPTVEAASLMSHLTEHRAEQLGFGPDDHRVIEYELVRRTALDLRRRKGERKARQVGHPGQRHVQQQRIGGLRYGVRGLWIRGSDLE